MKLYQTISKFFCLVIILICSLNCAAETLAPSAVNHAGQINALSAPFLTPLEILIQRIGADREDIVQFLQTSKGDANRYESVEIETAFVNYSRNCSEKLNELEQLNEILYRNIRQIKDSDLPVKDKKELKTQLETSMQKISRLKMGLKSSIKYCSGTQPQQWKKIHASWRLVNGNEKANERISSEIDTFIKDLPIVSATIPSTSAEGAVLSRFKDFEILPNWVCIALGIVVVVALIVRGKYGGWIFVIGSSFVLAAWIFNLLKRAIDVLF